MPTPLRRIDHAALLDQLPLSVFTLGPDDRIRYVNAFAAAKMHQPAQALLGKSPPEIGLEPELWQAMKADLLKVFADGEPRSFEAICRHGPERLMEYFLTPERDDRGQVATVTVTGSLIEDRRKLRDEVISRDAMFRRFMDHVPAIAWLRDSESRYVFCNKTYYEHYGLTPEDRLGKRPGDVWPAEIAAKFEANDRAVMDGMATVRVIEDAPDPDGTTHHWANVKFPFIGADGKCYIGGIGIDVSEERRRDEEQRKLENRLLHSQKLESLGLLAAGAAHDFNNLLTLVVGHAGLAKQVCDPSSPQADHLQSIEDAAKQMAELCQQMLAFAGRGRRDPRAMNLNLLVQDTVRLLRGMLPRNVAVHFDLAADIPNIFGDETQFRQIVMNLVTNAADCFGEHDGTIEIRTAIEIPSAAMLEDLGIEAKPKPYACLTVADDGPGMAKEVVARIFEPFFSTKVGGRGLGLAAVHGIVRAHHGLIAVESAPGRGSCFRVLLPISNGK